MHERDLRRIKSTQKLKNEKKHEMKERNHPSFQTHKQEYKLTFLLTSPSSCTKSLFLLQIRWKNNHQLEEFELQEDWK